ncbi:MAG TPA: hypothetical protein VD838_09435, partial [Anaeromyxobacteraceae bacterium]|nr:hypothetical protein [Anaeromyxobacteraceae bacterium]
MEEFRSVLGRRLGLSGPVGIGRNPAVVVPFFEAQLRAIGTEALVTECCDLATRSRSGTPGSLAWFVNWLRRLPAAKAPDIRHAPVAPADHTEHEKSLEELFGPGQEPPFPVEQP